MQRNCLDNVCFPLELFRRASGQAACKRAMELLEIVGLDKQGQSLPGAAVRRPAAARRHRPRAGNRPQGAAVRRSHQRARPQNHAVHPGTDPGHQPPPRHHRHHHHAPNERGGGSLQPRRDSGRRQHRGRRRRRHHLRAAAVGSGAPSGVPGQCRRADRAGFRRRA